MEYNTNWKAIQQWFLPCKSRHQIFVRQKNRCSSKAPENPIKAVWRMKTSPLTVEEITCIQEGCKVYKLDWMSVWRFFVPHREPSLLPRQWLVAFGTQRSYKQDEAKKERQCLYESKRKKVQNWRFGKFSTLSVYLGISSQFASARNGTSNKMEPNHPDSGMTLNTRKSQFFFQPYRGRRKSGASNSHLVKLVLDLPPVNLPQSVCVVSQADFKGFQFGASTKISVAGGGICNSGIENLVSRIPHAVNLGSTHSVKAVQKKNSLLKDNVRHSHPEESEIDKNKCIPEGRRIDSDLQMHPLLFQSPEDRRLPYY